MTPLIAATTSWPEAAIATWRTRLIVAREHAYRQLSEQTAADLRALSRRLQGDER
jgi:hypothetical protein